MKNKKILAVTVGFLLCFAFISRCNRGMTISKQTKIIDSLETCVKNQDIQISLLCKDTAAYSRQVKMFEDIISSNNKNFNNFSETVKAIKKNTIITVSK